MITLLALLTLMPYAGLFELEEDNFIQIVDSDTDAHYRVESGVLLLGGDPCGFDRSKLLKLEVTCIEYIDDHCVISVKGR
jgi:hypothetical protein